MVVQFFREIKQHCLNSAGCCGCSGWRTPSGTCVLDTYLALWSHENSKTRKMPQYEYNPTLRYSWHTSGN